ncbi:MraY family glycosyltransferase [Sulfitobacter sp. SH24]|uniref:MraY family glycosyltransferase n=1 Tax=Sulfitobacter sp. SH24 TaxID=3421173 RepID=UPI003F5093A0
MTDFIVFFSVFVTSLLVGSLFIFRPTLVMSSEHMLRDVNAPQAQHTRPTPRVGGVGVIIALGLGCLYYRPELENDLLLALAAGVFVFWAGLHEDIFRNVSPRKRFIAAFFSAGAAIVLTGHIVPDLGLFEGSLSKWVFPAVLITLLWSAGTCHALNLIDGLNGLSSLYCVCASAGFFVIAGHTGDTDVQILAGLLLAAILGFFVLNWPFGLIFLGDAGAYGIGHILAWISIVLVARNPDVAGLAVLLLLFWPVCDTLFSIIRRRVTKRPTGLPDRLHFHHLAVRTLRMVRRRRGRFDNPIASILLLPLIAFPIFTGVALWDQAEIAAFALAVFIFLFMATYVFTAKLFAARRISGMGSLLAVPLRRRGKKKLTSPLSGTYVQNETALEVQIFREHSKGLWNLNVLASGTGDVTYAGQFKSDTEAFRYFLEAA